MTFSMHFRVLAETAARLSRIGDAAPNSKIQALCEYLTGEFVSYAQVTSDDGARLGEAGALPGPSPLDADHFLTLSIQDRGGQLGKLSLARPMGVPAFSADDGRVADEIARLLANFLKNSTAAWEHEQLQRITDVIPMLVTYIDRDLIYRFNNKSYLEWFEIPHQAITGKRVREILGEEGFSIVRPWMERAMAGESVVFERILNHPLKGPRQVQIFYSPDASVAGNIRGIVVAVRDVTEERQLQQNLREAIQVRDDFVTIAAHELRTPLTSLAIQLRNLERISQKISSKAETNPVLEEVGKTRSQIRRLNLLVDNLLEMSRISGERFKLDRFPGDLLEIVQNAVNQTMAQFVQKGCALVFERSESIQGLWDSARLEQVIFNLLSNALKYGLNQAVQVRVFREGATAIIEVEDHGEGIDPALQSRIFQRFERSPQHRNVGGLGLGLFIIREIVTAHDGSISVQSEPNRGSCFTVRIPIVAGPLPS